MTTTTPGRPYGGVSFEERRAARRDRLLEAGLESFGVHGVAGTRVRDVCVAAGLTERYFYENFANLDEFLSAVLDKSADDFGREVRQAIADGPAHPEERLRAVISVIVAVTTDDPRLARLLFVEALGSGEGLASRRVEFMLRAADLIRIIVFPDSKSSRSRSSDAFVTSLCLAGGTAEILVAWVAGHVKLSRDAVIDQLVRLYTALAGDLAAPG